MKHLIITKGDILGMINQSLSTILMQSIGNAIHISQYKEFVEIRRCPKSLASKLLKTIGGEKDEPQRYTSDTCSWHSKETQLIEVAKVVDEWINEQ